MNKPKVPRRDCKKAAVWKAYYERMAAWFQESADMLEKDYPSAAKLARRDAEHFREGASSIANRTHPNIIADDWH